ncbi:MAG: hypothetical protein PHY31_09015 [Smithellaceae bacterium]|nr:hypothetical protein [Smithellaceae bacterium]
MKKLRTYYTGLISWDWFLYPPSPYKGKGWIVDFESTPKSRTSGPSSKYKGKRLWEREAVIKAHNYCGASNALEMINCAFVLCSGEPGIAYAESVVPKDKQEFENMFPDELSETQITSTRTSHFPLACMVAAKASHKQAYKYAIAKFRFATDLHSVFRVDIDPRMATEHLGVTPFTLSHVRYAYCIITAYSAIEEIGLEIRASSNNPSMINGGWNPKVKADIEKRLEEAGINLKEPCPWRMRGKPTRLERSRQLPSRGRCSWAKGPYVRDCNLDVIDAIIAASFLRSKISSHKMNPLVASLTSYDVENVRMLARRLLLERLGFWPPPWRNK